LGEKGSDSASLAAGICLFITDDGLPSTSRNIALPQVKAH